MLDVELIDVLKMYGTNLGVGPISLGVEKGEFVSLLGPSGCGKTTTLRLVAGFIEPTQGSILIRGKPVGDIPPHKRDIGIVFQTYALFPHMTAFENVAFGLRMRKFDRQAIRDRVERALNLVNLGGFEQRYPKQLSGGQQQRVALARAIVIQPTVLLLDEPLSNLDLKLREEMRVEIGKLQRKLGIATIYVTHDQKEALTMSDRIAVLNKGLIEQIGQPLEIYERPKTQFVADFIGQSNLMGGTVKNVDERGFVIATELGLEIRAKDDSIKVEPRQRVHVVIRPERINVTKTCPTGRENVFSGGIDDLIYLGDTIRLTVAVANQRMIAVLQSSRKSIGFSCGDTVWLEVNPEDCSLIQAT